jgi:hypothetical protein
VPPEKIETALPVMITPLCIHAPQIDYFMYHYIRSNDPHDNASTDDLSVDPQEFRRQMSYIHDLAKE